MKMFRLMFRVLGFITMAGTGLEFAFAAPRPFVSGSLAEIEKAHQGRPFLLMVWSLDCTSCVRELNVLGAQIKRHPEMPLIMVSTDGLSRQSGVDAMLTKHGLERLESWNFGEGNSQRLRYEIDRTWYGELPRSYFYDAGHQRMPLSGVITEEHIGAWLAATHAR